MAFQRKNEIKYSLRQTSEKCTRKRGCLATLMGKYQMAKKRPDL